MEVKLDTVETLGISKCNVIVILLGGLKMVKMNSHREIFVEPLDEHSRRIPIQPTKVPWHCNGTRTIEPYSVWFKLGRDSV